MDLALLLEYGWVLLVLVALEGLLAADNALVLAVMVKHLPEKQRKKALMYGLVGAFVFRIGSLFAISFIVGFWQVQALGALYLLFIALNHIIRKIFFKKLEHDAKAEAEQVDGSKEKSVSRVSFWGTVVKVELADIAFAVDSILAAVALAIALPATPLPTIGGLDGGQFLVIFFGGFIGVVIMRFAAMLFVKLIQRKPGLELVAFMIVGWVGVKLVVLALSHEAVGIIPASFAESGNWKLIFYGVLVLLAVGGWFLSKDSESYDEKSISTDSTTAESAN